MAEKPDVRREAAQQIPGTKEHEKAVDAVAEEVFEEGQEEADRIKAQRMVLGYAPPLDPGDPRPREVKEAEARKAMGIGPADPLKNPDIAKIAKGSATAEVLSDVDISRRVEQERAEHTLTGGMATTGTAAATGTERSVVVNGVAFIVPTGEKVKMPAAVADVLAQAAAPMRTAQMRGGGGLPVVDLRDTD